MRASPLNLHDLTSVGISVLVGTLAPFFLPLPYLPVFVLAFSLTLLISLGLSDFRKMVVAYLLLVPLVNINFVIDGPVAFKPLIGRGIHFDGMAMILVIFLWGVAWVRGRATMPKESKFLAIWVLYLAFAVLSVVANWTFRPLGQLWVLTEQFLYFGVFLALFSATREEKAADAMAVAIVLGSSAAAFLGLVNFALIESGLGEIPMMYWSHATYRTFRGTFHHRNFFGAYLLLTLPLTIAMVTRSNTGRRLLAKGGCVLQAVGISIARSKGALAAILAAGLFVIWNSAFPKAKKWIWIFVLAVYVAAAMYWTASSKVWGTTFESSFRVRLYILRMSLPVVQDGLFRGYGLDSFQEAFVAYEKKQVGDEVPSFRRDINKRIQKTTAHNSYLTRLVELGIGGFGAFVLLLGYVLIRLKPRKCPSPESFLDLPSLLIFSGVVGFLLHAQMDDLFSYSKLVVTFWAVAAVGIAAADQRKTKAHGRSIRGRGFDPSPDPPDGGPRHGKEGSTEQFLYML